MFLLQVELPPLDYRNSKNIKDSVMMSLKKFVKFSTYTLHSKRGFTLIEVMIALAITSILMVGIYSAYSIQQRSYKTQTMIVNVQQNLRGALAVMEDEIRMAGNDGNTPHTGLFGITDITIDGNGNGTLEFTGDFGDGNDNNGNLDANETIRYTIADLPVGTPDGIFDLARNAGGGRQLLAEGIDALGFAFAFDTDEDKQLDTEGGVPGGNVLWGYDSNGDNVLDANVAGVAQPAVNMDEIRAVRIWILARTKGNVSNRDTETYFIGTRTVPAFNDHHRRILLESTVKCRNMGL